MFPHTYIVYYFFLVLCIIVNCTYREYDDNKKLFICLGFSEDTIVGTNELSIPIKYLYNGRHGFLDTSKG